MDSQGATCATLIIETATSVDHWNAHFQIDCGTFSSIDLEAPFEEKLGKKRFTVLPTHLMKK